MISLPRDPRSRAERLERARGYVAALGLARVRAIVFGSVARGDLVAESDTDLLVVSDDLPAGFRGRTRLLYGPLALAPEVAPVGWRETEWRAREAAGDGFVAIVQREGVVL